MRKRNEIPPSMWALGPQGIYRLFGSAGHIRGINTRMVFFNKVDEA